MNNSYLLNLEYCCAFFNHIAPRPPLLELVAQSQCDQTKLNKKIAQNGAQPSMYYVIGWFNLVLASSSITLAHTASKCCLNTFGVTKFCSNAQQLASFRADATQQKVLQ